MNKVNCFRCQHFRTTWNPAFPRACDAYGFKTKELPSSYVLKSSGSECMQFKEKKRGKRISSPVNTSNIDYRL